MYKDLYHEIGITVTLSAQGIEYFKHNGCSHYIEEFLKPREVVNSAFSNKGRVMDNIGGFFWARKAHFDVVLEFESEWI